VPKPNLSLLDPHQQECAKLMRDSCHRHRLHEVFRDFCELSALAISNAVDKLQFESREARYLDIVKGYERDEVNRFARMLGCVTMSLEGGYKDCLGQLFMLLELGDHWRGQYFTPYTVSYLMAKMAIGATAQSDIAAAGGFITLQEPAVGAGGIVIAAAHALHDEKINYQQCLHVTATDIDTTAVHMTYIQLSLLHVPALVIHGNSLALTEWDHWVTPAHVLGMWDHRLRRREAERPGPAAVPKLPEHEDRAVAVAEAPPATQVVDLAEIRTSIAAERVARVEQLDLF
jgi:hypothetical protein